MWCVFMGGKKSIKKHKVRSSGGSDDKDALWYSSQAAADKAVLSCKSIVSLLQLNLHMLEVMNVQQIWTTFSNNLALTIM